MFSCTVPEQCFPPRAGTTRCGSARPMTDLAMALLPLCRERRQNGLVLGIPERHRGSLLDAFHHHPCTLERYQCRSGQQLWTPSAQIQPLLHHSSSLYQVEIVLLPHNTVAMCSRIDRGRLGELCCRRRSAAGRQCEPQMRRLRNPQELR